MHQRLAALAVATVLILPTGCEKGFQAGDCVEYVDAKGRISSYEDPIAERTPMRILGVSDSGKYLVEWRARPRSGGDWERYKNTFDAKTKDYHLIKVLCDSR